MKMTGHLLKTRRGLYWFCATCCANEGEEHLDWCHHEGVVEASAPDDRVEEVR